MASIPQVSNNMQVNQLQRDEVKKTTSQKIFEKTVQNPNFWAALLVTGAVAALAVTIALTPWIAPVLVPLVALTIILGVSIAIVNATRPRVRPLPAAGYVPQRPVYYAPSQPPVFIPVPIRAHYPHHHHYYHHHHGHHHYHGRRW